VSQGKDETDLYLTFYFEWKYPNIKEGSKEEKETSDQLWGMAGKTVQHTIDYARNMAREGKLGKAWKMQAFMCDWTEKLILYWNIISCSITTNNNMQVTETIVVEWEIQNMRTKPTPWPGQAAGPKRLFPEHWYFWSANGAQYIPHSPDADWYLRSSVVGQSAFWSCG